MKKLLLAALFVVLNLTVFAQSPPPGAIHLPPDGDNQKCQTNQWIGPVEISITYYSPDVHGRSGQDDRKGKIWGKVAHYGFESKSFVNGKGMPWRAGANDNTTISFSHDVKIEGKPIKAGTYGLFLAVGKEGPWTWIFSNNSTSWGSFYYDEAEDALRVQSMPQDVPYTEWLTFGFEDRYANRATAYLQWDDKRIPFKIEVDNVDQLYVDLIRKDLRNVAGFRTENLVSAASFCADKKINLEEALQWAERAVTQQENYSALQVKAKVLAAMGKDDLAQETVLKALNHPATSVRQINTYGRILLSQGDNDKAMEVFKLNSKRFPDDKFVTRIGLARGYTALGDKANAIKNWEMAIKNIPEDQKAALPTYEGELKKLKESK